MKRLSRIQGVNEILKIKTAERVSVQSELETVPQAVAANESLDLAVTLVQTEYIWNYNSIDNGVLTADNNGEIVLPDSLTHLTIHSADSGIQPEYLRPVGGKLYDTYNHTTDLGAGRTVRYSGRMAWDFEDLPVAFQMLAIAKVRLELAAGASFSAQRYAVEKDRHAVALQAANKFDDHLSGGRMRDPSNQTRGRAPRNRGFL